MLSAKRLREHLVLFAALLGVVALVSGLSVGVIGFLAQSADEGIRSGLASRAGADRALRATLAMDPDAAKQDAEVRAAIATSFSGIPVAVDRTVASRVNVAEITGGVVGSERRTAVLSIPDLPDRATIVDGAWPSAPDEVSVQVNGAARMDVVPGDQLRLGHTVVTVSGTWKVDDQLDPRWLGDPLITEGHDDVEFGPIIVDESLWPLDASPRARWTIVPDVSHLTAGDLTTIVMGWDSIAVDWRDQVSSNLVTLERLGSFKRAALEMGTRVDGLQAIQPVVLLLLAAIALVTLAELGRLLTTTRASEIALLWSRGASATDVGRATAGEVAVTASAGAALGTGVALAVLTVAKGSGAAGAAGFAVWVVPVAVTVGAVMVVAGSAFRSALRQTVRDPSDAAGRARRLAGPGVVILSAAAAALSVWQLWLYGSPLTPADAGGTDVDPIAVLAPALTLVAVVLLALVLFPRAAALGEVATRRAGVARILAARTVARRVQLVAAPIVVVAVAASTLVVASAYAATWSDSFQRTSELRAGGAVHASITRPGADLATLRTIGDLPGVDGVAAVDLETLQLGGDTGSIVAVTPETIAQVATSASGSFDRAAAARAMTAKVPGPAIPDGTTRLELMVSVNGFAELPAVSAQVLDGYGVLRSVPFDPPVDRGVDPASVGLIVLNTVSYGVDLPAELMSAPGPWRILAVDVAISRDAITADGMGLFGMTTLTATDGGSASSLELDKYWIPESPSRVFDPPGSNFNGLGFSVTADTRDVRMTPSFDDQVTDRTHPPVVISQRLADLYDLDVGDTLSFFLDDALDRSDCIVAQVVPAIPGADDETAVLLDLGVVIHSRLRAQNTPELPRELWVDADDPEAVAVELRPVLTANTRLQTSGDPAGRTVLGSAALALWLGALGCLVLAIITVVAVARAQLRARRLDVVVLRTIGLSSRGQASVRRREFALVLGYGGATGLIAGAAVALLTVPQLARAAVVEPYTTLPTPLQFDLPGLGIGLAALTAALTIIVAVYTARVAVQARTAIGAEETR